MHTTQKPTATTEVMTTSITRQQGKLFPGCLKSLLEHPQLVTLQQRNDNKSVTGAPADAEYLLGVS